MTLPCIDAAELTIDDDLAGLRLDAVLDRRLGLARRQVAGLVAAGRVRVDGRAVLVGAPRLEPGAVLEILGPEADPALLPERIPLPVLFEDARLMVVDKPARMPMYPGPRWPAGTVANALRGLGRPLSTVEGPLRPGIVHRLDAGTSGVLLVARDDDTHRLLARLFAARAVHRTYLALVRGEPAWEETLVEAGVGRRREGRKARAVREGGAPARTALRVLERFGEHALVEARPETGRTHQVRVHLASLGQVLVGDTLYGGGSAAARAARALGLERPALHAARITCEELGLDVSAPLPADLRSALEALGARGREKK